MLRNKHLVIHLLPNSSLVEDKLFALQHIPIHPSTLPRPRRHHRIQPPCLKLPLQRWIDLAHRGAPRRLLLLHTLALLCLVGLLVRLGLTSPAQALPVVRLVPLAEGSGVDLDDGGFCERVCADELVVGRVEGDADDADLAGDAFGAPGEVARFEAEGAVFGVAAAGADKMDAFGAYAGVGGLAAFFEGSGFRGKVRSDGLRDSRCVALLPLLAVVGSLCSGS